MNEELTLQFTVPADHPCLAGHFPGHPIVPAVVLLDLVASALIEQFLPMKLRVARISVARFVSPWLPCEVLTAHIVVKDARNAQVRAAVGERAVATFSLALTDA